MFLYVCLCLFVEKKDLSFSNAPKSLMSFDITSPGTPTMVFLQSLGRGIHRGIFSSFCAPPFVYLAWSGHRVRYRLYLEKSVLHGASLVLFISVGSLENLFKTDTDPTDSKETLKSTPKKCIKKHQIVRVYIYKDNYRLQSEKYESIIVNHNHHDQFDSDCLLCIASKLVYIEIVYLNL